MRQVKLGKIHDSMFYSENGTYWLAGQTVKVLKIDNGKSWESCIVKVEGENTHNKPEIAWINRKDIKI